MASTDSAFHRSTFRYRTSMSRKRLSKAVQCVFSLLVLGLHLPAFRAPNQTSQQFRRFVGASTVSRLPSNSQLLARLRLALNRFFPDWMTASPFLPAVAERRFHDTRHSVPHSTGVTIFLHKKNRRCCVAWPFSRA